MISKPITKQFGSDGWQPHYEQFVACSVCREEFLSDKDGYVHLNGAVTIDCPYCGRYPNEDVCPHCGVAYTGGCNCTEYR